MPRPLRCIEPNIPHHITQRGNNHEVVFRTDEDRDLYLRLLDKHSRRHGLALHAYCLMTNHIHLIAVPVFCCSIPRALQRTQSEYAQEYNRRYERRGHLWQGRYFAAALIRQHLWNAFRYVELNPVRAGLSTRPEQWQWSSAQAHLGIGPPTWLSMEIWRERFDPLSWREMLGQDLTPADLLAIRTRTH